MAIGASGVWACRLICLPARPPSPFGYCVTEAALSLALSASCSPCF